MSNLLNRTKSAYICVYLAVLRFKAIKVVKTYYNVSLSNSLSEEARYFLEPKYSKQCQYEALRAHYVENPLVKVASEQFGNLALLLSLITYVKIQGSAK